MRQPLTERVADRATRAAPVMPEPCRPYALLAWAVGGIAFWGIVGFVAWHFLAKYW